MPFALFSQLALGYASAEEESTEAPDLLLSGYLDHANIINEAVNGPKFLFLGYKGSGKSAINEHLRLTSESQPQLFVSSSHLADFPYSDLKKILVGDIEPEAKYPTTWSWLLLLKLINSFTEDQGATNSQSAEFISAVSTLDQLGLRPLPEFKHVVAKSSKKSFRVNLGKILERQNETTLEDQSLQLPFFIDRLKKIASKFRSSSRHLLVIDGLDDILSKREIQYQSLAALIFEVASLNRGFRQVGCPAKIIILCRTDLFERLPNANKNKLRQDMSINLDWYQNTRDPSEANLVKLVNLRAKLQEPLLSNVFTEYFPSQCESRPVIEFLLELTRHTPRDFIQLLKHIQKFAGPSMLKRDEILSGVRSYSLEYFFLR